MGSEAQRMRSFVAKQLRECADISTLTKKKIRGRYLAHRGVDWISQEDWQHLKRIVEEELLKMEDTDSSDEEPLSKKVLSKSSANLKRKREAEAERTHGGRVEEEEEEEEEVAKKKKRPRVDRRSPDSADSGIERAGKVESEEEEEQLFPVVAAERQAKVGKRTVKHNVAKRSVGDGKGDVRKKERLAEAQGEGEHEEGDEDATEHASEDSDKEEKGGEASCSGTRLGGEEEEEDDDEKHPEMKKKGGSLPRCLSSSDSEGDTKGSGGADEKSEGESGEEGSMPRRTVPSSEEGQGMARAGAEEETEAGPGSLSDSSSLPSLDDDDDDEEGARSTTKSQQVKKKTKAPEDTDSVKGRKAEENRKVSRLKRYIALCGVRRNYKKLLDGCRSVKSQVAVLKKELEELGVVGQPSIEKCKKARLKREQAQELAELDVTNIITSQGRTRRRVASRWPPAQASASPDRPYKWALDSDSDGEEADRRAVGPCRRRSDWSNLQGIISDGGESE